MGNKMSCHSYRTGSRAASSVRCRERLVQIQMEHIKAHVTRTYHTHQRVHVSSVIIEQTAALMNQSRNLLDILLEQSEGIRIGHHDAGDGVIKQRLEVLDIHKTVGL